MNILIVGAGAVGAVYGRHLQLGGADVTFYVKPKYTASLAEGIAYYPLNKGRNKPPVIWEQVPCVTTPEEVAASRWDQVWLCVSSTALRGAWLDQIIEAMGDATLVMLQPGLEDRQYILERLPEEQLVQGVITLISYQAPLSTESRPQPGFAYWLPPLTPNPFSGPKDRVRAVVKALKAGGCPAAVQKDASRGPAYLSVVLMPFLVLLESEGWSFQRFRTSQHLGLMVDAIAEGMAIVSRFRGEKPPLWRIVVRKWLFKLVLRLQGLVVPLDLETYFAYHFTKVGDQTRMMMETYIEQGREFGLSTSQLERLAGLLPAEEG